MLKSRTFFFVVIQIFKASMDLPPDKVKLLRQYDDEKKWDMICDQVKYIFFNFITLKKII